MQESGPTKQENIQKLKKPICDTGGQTYQKWSHDKEPK